MSTHCPIDVSDHERLSQLVRDDPQAFETLRNELIADFIGHEPEKYQRRLRGLQFRVDCLRRLSHTPLAAFLKIQTLMWESFLKMDHELQKFVQRIHDSPVSSENTKRLEIDSSLNGRVIELRSYQPNRHGYG